jgi:hypothetical protein
MDRLILDNKIEAIIDYLTYAQKEDGEFKTLRYFKSHVDDYVTETEHTDWYDFGKCPFAAANILYHLSEIHHPKVYEIIKKGCLFLSEGFENGVVRYIPGRYKNIDFPADVDDTALTAAALIKNGYPVDVNIKMILANSDRKGNFYTWLIPRINHLKHPGNFYWLCRDLILQHSQNLKYEVATKSRNQRFKEYKTSREPGITANVLLLTSINRSTKKHLATLIKRMRNNDIPLQYYSNILAEYFQVARLYKAGVMELITLKDQIVSDILLKQNQNGEVENPFNTALAALSLIFYVCWDLPALEAMINYVVSNPMHEEGWRPFHYCNDLENVFEDGGAELTATFYLHIINSWRYKHYPENESN